MSPPTVARGSHWPWMRQTAKAVWPPESHWCRRSPWFRPCHLLLLGCGWDWMWAPLWPACTLQARETGKDCKSTPLLLHSAPLQAAGLREQAWPRQLLPAPAADPKVLPCWPTWDPSWSRYTSPGPGHCAAAVHPPPPHRPHCPAQELPGVPLQAFASLSLGSLQAPHPLPPRTCVNGTSQSALPGLQLKPGGSLSLVHPLACSTCSRCCPTGTLKLLPFHEKQEPKEGQALSQAAHRKKSCPHAHHPTRTGQAADPQPL